ncbi:MAG: GNAT family N-acetyltransferase, partial [Herbiconiux sp.]|nr:GNAT family N-acetyltransferase [Herbiconiux sp.]
VIAQLVERPRWGELLRVWPWLVAISLSGIIGYSLLLYSALQYIDPLSASLINAFNPALISLAAVFVLRQRLTASGVVGILLALVGVLIVLSKGSFESLVTGGFGGGDLLMVGAILAWTAYTILIRRAPKVPPISSTAVQAVIALVVLAPVTLLTGSFQLPSTAEVWGAVAFIVIFPSVLSYLLWNRALGVIPPARAGVFLNLIAVFTALLTLLMGQPFTASQLVGGVIVLGGVALANAQAFRRAPAPVVPGLAVAGGPVPVVPEGGTVEGMPDTTQDAPRFTIRRTVEDDWPEVRRLRLEMLADTPIAYLETLAQGERRSEAEWRAWARGGSSTDSITVVAVDEAGRLVATMMSRVPGGASGAYLYGVYVAPAFRGREVGVTDALLARVEEWAAEQGDSLSLEVHEQNGRAIAAYRSRGFEPTGVTRPYPLDAAQREIEMRKPLR